MKFEMSVNAMQKMTTIVILFTQRLSYLPCETTPRTYENHTANYKKFC